MEKFRMGFWVLGLALLAGCSTDVRESPGENPSAALEQARDSVRGMARDTLQRLYAEQPGAQQAVEHAAGYAVFSDFGTKILITGSGSGKGIAVDNATRHETFMRMVEFEAGLGFGVQEFRQVWVFQERADFEQFINSGYEFGGEAALAAKASGQGDAYAGAVSVSPGVWLYQITQDGLAAELTFKGAKYYRDKGLDGPAP